ncbi:hypothetical protein CH333_07810 [candidate division WOR-3 bacterium JGI_Cruoil_03_44_89]|uniref:Exo-alpha-sialidase n=1 Tax=candidate division WOR-3 bacterium JGI_Cruoil_03_44_89 TaxID=1973748 RepID=A0A235BPV1_UNCW3|nr:MAG: hypothetical protein CH333_07810 [candidate division WOR-3 bacterium JGI_Cruoil_03_44_89]
MGIKVIKSVKLLISFVLVFLVSCSCDKSPTDGGNNHYDPRNVSRNEGKSLVPSLTVDDIGNVHLVWADSTPGNYEILYSMKGLGGDWSEPMNISNTPTTLKGPKVAIDPSGNLHIVWVEELSINPYIRDILYSMKLPGDSCSTAINISNTSPYQGADLPDIGVDASGNVHVVWWELTAMYRMKNAGGTWNPVESTPLYGRNLAMVVSANGDVHLVSEGGSYSDIYYTMKPSEGSWTEPVKICETPFYSWTPDIAIEDEGSLYVVWAEEQKGMLYFSEKSDSGTWMEADSIVKTKDTQLPWACQLIAENQGILHLLWSERTEGGDVYYITRSGDGIWSGMANVSETSGNSLCLSISLDASGSLHIAWQDETPGKWDIFYTMIQTR